MLTKDLNAGYCCSHGLCCFSMIRSEGPEALMAIEQGVTTCQHHLYMAFMRVAHGAPAGWRSGESSLGGQLGLDPGSKSKIGDGSTVRPPRPHRTSVADF